MRTVQIIIMLIVTTLVGCNKVDLPDPVIHNFTATPTTLPSRDTVTFSIDAEGDFISFYNGKATIDLSEEEMPYEYKVEKIRFRISPPADTVYAKLVVTNVYDTDQIKYARDSIKFILLEN